MYVSKQAWLNLTPLKDSSQTNRDYCGEHYPPLTTNYSYLITCLNEMGNGMQSGFGLTPLTFTEIEAWSNLSGMQLAPMEANLLRRLSESYCAIAANNAADDPMDDSQDEQQDQATLNALSWLRFAQAES